MKLDYRYESTFTKARNHVVRYPRHYAALALWCVAMVLIPAIGGPATFRGVAERVEFGSGTRNVPAAPLAKPTGTGLATGSALDVGRAAAAAAISSGSFSGGAADAFGPSDPGPGAAAPEPQPSPGEDPEEADGVGGLGALVPAPPPLPLPPVPAEVRPVAAALSPIMTSGCSAIGLAGVVLSVVAPTTGEAVPVDKLMPYLVPLYQVCAQFPLPEGRTVCALDEAMNGIGYPKDVAGLFKTPALMGVGIDVIEGFEEALAEYGVPAGGLAQQLRDQLDCEYET